MSCDRVRSTLAETLTGAADPAAAEGHLEACASCRAHLESLEALEGRLRALPLLPSPRTRSSPRWGVAAAAALFFGVLALLLPRAPETRPFATSGAETLSFPDGSTAELDPGSRGEWSRGGLRVLAGGGRFRGLGRLETPSGLVRGAGADFRARLGDGLAVDVASGRVSVDYDARSFVLGAGQGGVFGAQDSDARPGQDERYGRLLKRATLSLAQALPLAVALAGGGTAIEAELEEEEGSPAYAVLVAKGDKVVEILVDAASGRALGEPREKKVRKTPPFGALGLARAVDLALRAVPGAAVNAELEEEEGKPAASVRVYDNGKSTKALIDAESGRLLKVSALERKP